MCATERSLLISQARVHLFKCNISSVSRAKKQYQISLRGCLSYKQELAFSSTTSAVAAALRNSIKYQISKVEVSHVWTKYTKIILGRWCACAQANEVLLTYCFYEFASSILLISVLSLQISNLGVLYTAHLHAAAFARGPLPPRHHVVPGHSRAVAPLCVELVDLDTRQLKELPLPQSLHGSLRVCSAHWSFVSYSDVRKEIFMLTR